MMLALLVVLALTRAEIIQRMRAPILTRADGLIKVYASCDEDIRRDYQVSVARAADETVRLLYGALSQKPERFDSPGIILRLGNIRTNVTDVVSSVETNGARVVSRIFLKSPAHADPERFELEVTRAFYRTVVKTEISDDEARAALHRANPRYRIADERAKLEAWLAGSLPREAQTEEEFFSDLEKMLTLYRKVIEPGKASRRDVLTFASRLCLYPRYFDEKFVGGADVLTFEDAISVARKDPRVRILAVFKARELPVWAGGRGEVVHDAAQSYMKFLFELAKGDQSDEEIKKLLEIANLKLKAAYEQAES